MQGNLYVVGAHKDKHGHNMLEVVCSICNKDIELFPEPFNIRAASYNSGIIPCDCGITNRIRRDFQYRVLVKRKFSLFSQDFLGFNTKKVTRKSKVYLYCPIHGALVGHSVGSIINTDCHYSLCPKCITRKAMERRGMLSEEDLTNKLVKIGDLVAGTTFKRTDQRNVLEMYCPTCNTVNSIAYSSALAGRCCCACYVYNSRYLYINIILDDNLPIALKYGITKKYR